MEIQWTCPQCETVNESSDNCVVCGMSYLKAVEVIKENNERLRCENQEKHSELRLNFPNSTNSVQNVKYTEEPKKSLYSIIKNAIYRFVAFFAAVFSGNKKS